MIDTFSIPWDLIFSIKTVFKIIYAASSAGCLFCLFECFDGVKGEYQSPFYKNYAFDSSFAPGVAGFMIFPVINTFVFIACLIAMHDNKAKGNIPKEQS